MTKENTDAVPRTYYFQLQYGLDDELLELLRFDSRYLMYQDRWNQEFIPKKLERYSDYILEVNSRETKWLKKRWDKPLPKREDILFWLLQQPEPYVPFPEEDLIKEFRKELERDLEKYLYEENRNYFEEEKKKKKLFEEEKKRVNTSMKQRKILHEIYQACLSHDSRRQLELQMEEFKKIFKRKAKGKSVADPKYTVVR